MVEERDGERERAPRAPKAPRSSMLPSFLQRGKDREGERDLELADGGKGNDDYEKPNSVPHKMELQCKYSPQHRRIEILGSIFTYRDDKGEEAQFPLQGIRDRTRFLYGHRDTIQGYAWYFRKEEGPLLASVASDFIKARTDDQQGKKGGLLTALQQGWEQVKTTAQNNIPSIRFFDTPPNISTQGEIIIWDVKLKTPILSIDVVIKRELVAMGGDTEIDMESTEERGVCGVCWSPDGSALAVGGVRTVFLIDARTGRALCKPTDLRWAYSLAETDNVTVEHARCLAWSPPEPGDKSKDGNAFLAIVLNDTGYARSYIYISQVQSGATDKRKSVTRPKCVRKRTENEEQDIHFPHRAGKMVAAAWYRTDKGLFLFAFSASDTKEINVDATPVNTVCAWRLDTLNLEVNLVRRWTRSKPPSTTATTKPSNQSQSEAVAEPDASAPVWEVDTRVEGAADSESWLDKQSSSALQKVWRSLRLPADNTEADSTESHALPCRIA